MAYTPPPMPGRGTLMGPPPPTDERKVTVNPQATETPLESEPELEPPPEKTYPCGCPFPGQHKTDCMWSMWEQMRDNYLQTKELMGKFMTQAVSMQEGDARPKCECPPSCHGRDLGEAMGLQQMHGVTVPWGQHLQTRQIPAGPTQTPGYPVESEARQAMEEQKRIKNTWVQFLNIFNMSMDLANDVSRDRWEANKRRKERARLERQERLEEQRRQRQARSSITTTTATEKTPDQSKKKGEEKLAKDEPKRGVQKSQSESISKAASPEPEQQAEPVEETAPEETTPDPEQTAPEEAEATEEPAEAG
uniref:Uncharacterized protein n=1 Tax=Cuerna arida TaxID=1464854 RepID=A0A1B6GRR8_9HEMI